jgi:hypothetical protein
VSVRSIFSPGRSYYRAFLPPMPQSGAVSPTIGPQASALVGVQPAPTLRSRAPLVICPEVPRSIAHHGQARRPRHLALWRRYTRGVTSQPRSLALGNCLGIDCLDRRGIEYANRKQFRVNPPDSRGSQRLQTNARRSGMLPGATEAVAVLCFHLAAANASALPVLPAASSASIAAP